MQLQELEDGDLSYETDLDLKHAGSTVKNAKEKKKRPGDMKKRVFVGAFILSMYTLTYNIGVFYQTAFAVVLHYMMVFELIGIARNQVKDRETRLPIYEHLMWLTCFWATLNQQYANYKSLNATGFTKQEYPILYCALFEYQAHILLALFCFTFVAVIMSLQPKNLRYQLSQFCFAALVCPFAAVSAPTFAMLSRYGRFMYFFPQLCTATNDGFAYFFGKAFGRTKLIALSPNKTVEGFIGGMLANIIQTFIFSGIMLESSGRDYWICNSSEYVVDIFYDYKCQDVHPVFLPQTFSAFGIQITCMPAQIYSVVFGLSASLVGPFVGFLASGLKRAYGIKDFASTFPGHGGTIDRFDCQIYSVVFCGMIMSQFIFREDMAMDNIKQRYELDLSAKERDIVLGMLSELVSQK